MSSLIRRIEKRIMKSMNVDLVPCPYGRTQDSGLTDDKGKPITMPIMVYPRLIPASFRDSFKKVNK